MCTYGTYCSVLCVCVLDERERGLCEAPGAGRIWFASHTGLSGENLGYEGETHTTSGPRQHTAQRKPGFTAAQSR